MKQNMSDPVHDLSVTLMDKIPRLSEVFKRFTQGNILLGVDGVHRHLVEAGLSSHFIKMGRADAVGLLGGIVRDLNMYVDAGAGYAHRSVDYMEHYAHLVGRVEDRHASIAQEYQRRTAALDCVQAGIVCARAIFGPSDHYFHKRTTFDRGVRDFQSGREEMRYLIRMKNHASGSDTVSRTERHSLAVEQAGKLDDLSIRGVKLASVLVQVSEKTLTLLWIQTAHVNQELLDTAFKERMSCFQDLIRTSLHSAEELLQQSSSDRRRVYQIDNLGSPSFYTPHPGGASLGISP